MHQRNLFEKIMFCVNINRGEVINLPHGRKVHLNIWRKIVDGVVYLFGGE